MSGRDPIDFDSPLGISKREWTKVLGANLALLLLAYCVALVFTLCGNGAFLLNYENAQLKSMETTLRSIGLYPIVHAVFSTVESTIIACYVSKAKPRWWLPVGYLAAYIGLNVLFTQTTGSCPSWLSLALGILFCVIFELFKDGIKKPTKLWKPLLRLIIAMAVSLLLNELISIFRTKIYQLFQIDYDNASFFALSIEYDIALVLALGFLTLLIPWEKGGSQQCLTDPAAGGSSPTSKRWSRKNSLTKNNLNPKQRRKIALLKAKVIVIQTVALAVIAALPWFAGRPVEFTLLYLAFCLTRVILGFSHSLHFKSELACVTIGALTFWGLTFLAPSAEASIILSLAYGAGLALGFRLWWELHDLMMYRKAAKTDRYAMFYTAFKGNIDPRHIRGVMRLRGFSDESYIKAVQMYMAKDKVDYIAEWLNEPLRSVDRKLTEIADELYRMR